MKYQELQSKKQVYYIESNPNYILEAFEGIRKKNSRIILLILLVLIMINYLIFLL